ncbi:hypothetical protein VPH35_080663 [Triticum aestivum]
MRALRLFGNHRSSYLVPLTNSFKLWDLSMNRARVIDNPIQTSTGHINTKVRYPPSIFVLAVLAHTCYLLRVLTPSIDVHIIMNDGQLISYGIAGGCRESALIHVHCPLCISVMLSYFSQQEDAFVYVHCP